MCEKVLECVLVCAGLSISCVFMVCVCVCMHTYVHTNLCETCFVHGDGTLNSLQSLATCIETVNQPQTIILS